MSSPFPFTGSLRQDTYRIDYRQASAAAAGALLLLNDRAPEQLTMDHAFFVAGGAAFSAAALGELFADTALHFAHDPLMQDSGTTATLAHITADGLLHIAYVGDSPAFIYCREGRATEARVRGQTYTLVNPHLPTTPAELARIEKAGGVVIDGFLDNDLPVSRALGDRSFRGITYKPDCHTFDLTPYFRHGQEAVVAVTNDETHRATAGTAMTLILREPPAETITLALFAGHGRDGAHVSRNVAHYMAACIGPGAHSGSTATPLINPRRFRFFK